MRRIWIWGGSRKGLGLNFGCLVLGFFDDAVVYFRGGWVGYDVLEGEAVAVTMVGLDVRTSGRGRGVVSAGLDRHSLPDHLYSYAKQ